jgi:apolipoprotein N-acyltransferase
MTEMAGSASSASRGPVGETRSIGLSIVWFILTVGIYGIYWVYKTQEEVKRYSGHGVGGVLGIVIYLLISPVTFFVVPSEVRFSPVRGIYGLWILLPIFGPIIWFVQVQGALNGYWESKGAPPA